MTLLQKQNNFLRTSGTNDSSHRQLKAFDPKTVEFRTPVFNANTAASGGLSPPPVGPNAHPTFQQLLDQYVPQSERSGYLINVGAKDGKDHDPTYPLLYDGYDGILFEGDEDMKERLYSQIAALPHYKTTPPTISWGFLSPDTVIPRLAEGGARKDLDALKIDIDSFDAQLLEIILEKGGYRPKIVMVEFNPDIPPPISWHQLYSDHPFNMDKVEKGNYGVSASSLYHIMTEKFGYGLVGLEVFDSTNGFARWEHNMWFVSGDMLQKGGYRAMDHKEMTELFWSSHYDSRRIKCLHAKRPCLLKWPDELKSAIPGFDDLKNELSLVQQDVLLSMTMADPDISCELWKLYDKLIVGPFLHQIHLACEGGDPCLESMDWMITLPSSQRCARFNTN